MKKILLLCGIIMCCLSGFGQSIFLTAQTTPTNSGTSVVVKASGETSNSFIIGSQGAPTSIQTFPSQTYASNVTGYLAAPVTYYNPSTGAPFSITLTVNNYNCTQVSAVFYYSINVQTNGVAGWVTMSVAIQINSGCATTYWNVAESGNFTRNNCTAGSTGSTVTYTVPAHTYSSTTSQAAANQLAINDVNANGQNYANSNTSGSTCSVVYWNVAKSGTFTRNNCGSCSVGSTRTYTVPAHTYSSTTSQAAADALATADVAANGQAYANNGTCTASGAPVITSIILDGSPIVNGANLVKGTHHNMVVNYTSGVTSGQIYTTATQSITITPYPVTIGSSSSNVGFWYSDMDTPPAPIVITLTNACGTTTKVLNFYPQ